MSMGGLLTSGVRLGILCCVPLVGCDSGRDLPASSAEATPSGVSQHDSAGVAISVTPGSGAREPLEWVVSAAPDIVIGDEETPADVLHRVRGATQLPDGGFLIIDGGSAELRFFDQTGRATRSVGGRGEGPGEFHSPLLVPAFGTDSLFVFDTRLRRAVFVSPSDGGHRTVRPHEGFPAIGWPLGIVGARVLLELVPVERSTRTGVQSSTATYRWTELEAGSDIPVASFEIPQLWIEITPGYAPSGTAIPFSPRRAPAAVSPAGAFLYDPREGTVLRLYDLDGRLRRIFRIDLARRPVTESMLEAEMDRLTENRPAAREVYGRAWAKMPIPDSLPVFASLRLDRSGWLWAEEFVPRFQRDPREPKSWIVFDPDGQARGTIETPPRLEVHDIGVDYILGVWTSELGVEQVRRYPLRRD